VRVAGSEYVRARDRSALRPIAVDAVHAARIERSPGEKIDIGSGVEETRNGLENARIVPAVIVRKADDLAGGPLQPGVAASGQSPLGASADERKRGMRFNYRIEVAIRILVHEDHLERPVALLGERR